jgi:acetyl esterase/lipase
VSWGSSTTRTRAARLTVAVALALAVVTACAPTPGTTATPAPVIENYGGTDFEFRRDVPYRGEAENRYDLWLPLTGPAPLVAFIHGGFWSTQGAHTRKSLPPQVKDLLLSGYAVASIDYRGVLQPCGASLCSQTAILGDVKAALGHIAFISASDRVDADRINLVGFSAGGHLAMMAGMTYDSPTHASNGIEVRINTVTSIAGPTDLEALYAFSAANFNFTATLALETLGGGWAPNNTQHAPISQTAPNAGLTDPPLYLIYSPADELVPYAQATAMVDAATTAGIDVTLSPRAGIAHDPMRLQVNTAALAAWLAPRN